MTIIQMTNADYHRHPAIGSSLLSRIAKSPAHARAYIDNPPEETAAMAFGSAFHAAVLDPDEFGKQYAVFEADKRTKEGKMIYEMLVAEGKKIIKRDDFETIQSMAAAIRQHPTAGPLLTGGKAEQSVFYTDEDSGMDCKCRPDYWRDDGIVIDLKSTDDASPQGFARSVAKYNYHIQAIHYLAGTQAKRFIFIAVEKTAPFAIGVYELDNEALSVAYEKRRALLEYWKSCSEAQFFPAYQDEIVSLSLPAYAVSSEII